MQCWRWWWRKFPDSRFGDFLHDRIFAPLDMKQTVAYEKGKNTVTNRAYGHTHEGARGANRTRVRRRLCWAMAAFIPLSTIWPNGTGPWRITCSQRGRDEAGDYSSQSDGWQRAGT